MEKTRRSIYGDTPIPMAAHPITNDIYGDAHDPRRGYVIQRVSLLYPLPNTNKNVLRDVFGIGTVAERCQTHVKHFTAITRYHGLQADLSVYHSRPVHLLLPR